ncbi:MAG: response regulator [Methylococcaceae bacterium]
MQSVEQTFSVADTDKFTNLDTPNVSFSVSPELLECLPGFELTNILTMLSGNEEKLVNLLKKFREKYVDEGHLIQELISADNLVKAEEHLHALKGTAGNLGITLLHRASDELHNQLKNARYSAQTLENFDSAFKKAMATIANLSEFSIDKKILVLNELSTFQKIVENLNDLLVNDRFVEDELLDELKLHLYEHQHAAYGEIVQKIYETEYPQARLLLKNLLGYCTIPKTSEPDTTKLTILVVDDNRMTQEAFVSFLKPHYLVKVAISGARALSIAKATANIGLILLDVSMPDMDGYEVCKQLKNDVTTTDIPIIFITVGTDSRSEVRGLQLGAVDYLKKPIGPVTTLLRIKNQLLIAEKNKATRQQLVFQHAEKERYSAELVIATQELVFQSSEIQDRAVELRVAHSENDVLNHQVNQMQKLESIGQLTAGITHDFNNVLACMLGYNEMNLILTEDIIDKGLKAQIEKNIQQIDFAGQRAVSLIQKIMGYCRESSLKMSANTPSTRKVIEEVVAMLTPALTSRIKLELALNCDENIKIDTVDLHQILTNLAVNARDAMKNRGGVIHISLKTTRLLTTYCTVCAKMLTGNFIELSVSDNGVGIDPKIVSQIFTPFFTTKELGEGTGLGLSTVSSIVHHSNGHILIDSKHSQPNQGTAFRLLFPLLPKI